MKEVYNCTPEEFYRQDKNIIDMHSAFLAMKGQQDELEMKRTEQRMKQNAKKI